MTDTICFASHKVVAKNASSPNAFPTETRRDLLLALFIICVGCVPLFHGIFWWNRESYSRLRIRSISLVFLYPIALLLYAFSELLPEIIGIINFSCALQTFLFLCIAPSIGTIQICRNSFFLMTTRFYRATYIYGRVTAAELLDEGITQKDQGFLHRIRWFFRTIIYGLSLLLHPSAAVGDMSREERIRTLFALKFLRTNRATVMLYILVSFPFYFVALLIVVTDPVYIHCTGCRRDEFITFVTFGEAVIYISFGLAVAIRARKLPDQFGMLREGRVSLLWTIVAFVGFVLIVWVPVDPGITYDNQVIITIGLVGAFFVVSVWQVWLSRKFDREANTKKNRIQSRRQTKQVVESSPHMSSGNQTKSIIPVGAARNLDDILSNESLKAKFEKFLVSEFTQESMFFLYDTFDWRQAYHDVGPSARNARARRIVSAYIDSAGLYAINIPDARDIIHRSKQEDIPIEFFDDARFEVARLLENGSVLRFRQAAKEDVVRHEVTAAVNQF